MPDPRGGLRGTCPPKRPKVPVKTTKKKLFFSCTAERKGWGRGGTDRAVPRLANDAILNPLLSGNGG